MQFCQPHWDMTREACRVRGLEHLGAKSGEEAAQNMADQLQGTDRPEDFDPLMNMFWALSNKVLERIAANDPGEALARLGAAEWCPMCEIQASYDLWEESQRPEKALDAQGWIDSCADFMLSQARELGLMPGVQ